MPVASATARILALPWYSAAGSAAMRSTAGDGDAQLPLPASGVHAMRN
ncbi:hypothetical protein [uncultured Stenotrophomonas sp.]|nr:hypothetical protein [uncultured Stenotrophomonas sp.]